MRKQKKGTEAKSITYLCSSSVKPWWKGLWPWNVLPRARIHSTVRRMRRSTNPWPRMLPNTRITPNTPPWSVEFRLQLVCILCHWRDLIVHIVKVLVLTWIGIDMNFAMKGFLEGRSIITINKAAHGKTLSVKRKRSRGSQRKETKQVGITFKTAYGVTSRDEKINEDNPLNRLTRFIRGFFWGRNTHSKRIFLVLFSMQH